MGLDLPDWTRGAVTIARGEQVAANTALPDSTNLFIFGMDVYQSATIRIVPSGSDTTETYRLRYTHRINNVTVAIGEIVFWQSDTGNAGKFDGRIVTLPLLGDELIISLAAGNGGYTYNVTVYASTRPVSGVNTLNTSRSSFMLAAGGDPVTIPAGSDYYGLGTAYTGKLGVYVGLGNSQLRVFIEPIDFEGSGDDTLTSASWNVSGTVGQYDVVWVPVGAFQLHVNNPDTSSHTLTCEVVDL